MKTLREQLGLPVLFHRVGWQGKDGPSVTGYDSRDPAVILDQLKAMQDWGGEGAGVIHLTYGPTVSTFLHESSMECCNQCNALGMPFALCYDPWTVSGAVDKSAAMIAALVNSETQFMLNSPMCLAGRPVLDFATGADPAIVKAAVPEVEYWMNGIDYDWIRIPTQPNKTKLPCAYWQFDDGTGPDRNKQADNQALPVRLVNAQGGRTFWACNMTPGAKYVQIVTWDDYKEQTAVEPFASMVSGKI